MTPWIAQLQKISEQKSRRIAGMISGTSVDAIKVAICRIEGQGWRNDSNPGSVVTLEHFHAFKYPDDIRARLYRSLELSVPDVSLLNVRVGEVFADAFHAACAAGNIDAASVDLIGSHGQTIYHHSRQPVAVKSSYQIGDGDVIAERTGLPVFFDFRARDIAAGGEGAPLTPYSDLVLFGSDRSKERAILNLGGIANVTFFNRTKNEVIGFDTGPANGPLDRLARIISGGKLTHDKDSKIALSGTVNQKLLKKLLAEDSFLKLPPPKSSGFEMYGDIFVDRLVAENGAADADLLATITEFVGQAIGDALSRFATGKLEELIIAGGGGQNPALLAAIARAVAPITVRLSDELGVPSAARESIAFAIFANDTLMGTPSSMPSITGVSSPRLLGKLALPPLATV